MQPFEFVIAFFSFVFAIALAHLLLGATDMIRHRKEVVYSVPHLLWMVVALAVLVANWLSLWDFHMFKSLTLGTILWGFVYCLNIYVICALVTPELNSAHSRDLRAFHEAQGRTYMGATLCFFVLTLLVNYLTAVMGLDKWGAENGLVIFMPWAVLLAMIFRKVRWVQIAAPMITVGLVVTYMVMFYPSLVP